MQVRPATVDDLPEVLRVEREAFGGSEEAELVEALLGDPSADPHDLACRRERPDECSATSCSPARWSRAPKTTSSSFWRRWLWCPRRSGREWAAGSCGGRFAAARDAGAVAVLVLGHIEYYPRFGFEPAAPHGLVAPYPIPDEVADAWMVAELVPGALGTLRGSVRVAEVLMKPEYWRE